MSKRILIVLTEKGKRKIAKFSIFFGLFVMIGKSRVSLTGKQPLPTNQEVLVYYDIDSKNGKGRFHFVKKISTAIDFRGLRLALAANAKRMPSLLLFLVIFDVSSARAQEPPVIIPPVAPPDFSQLVGKYHISSSASPTEVIVEEPITLKVRIVGQGPPEYRPERKNLHIFPADLDNDFHVEAVPDQDHLLPEKGVWEFVYRLRPKRTDVARIPELKLKFYAPDSKRFVPSFADEIPITVTPRSEATAEKMNLKVVQAPERFYKLRPVEEVLRDDSPMPAPSPEMLAALLAGPPLLCFVWYRLWRRWYPNAAERRRRRHSKAARLALNYLSKQKDDVPRTRAAAVDYLRQRLDLPALDPAPQEVARHLKRLGIAKPLIADWSKFLQACDQVRYAPSARAWPGLRYSETPAVQTEPASATGVSEYLNPGHPGDFNAEAIRLINAVEGDPCVIS